MSATEIRGTAGESERERESPEAESLSKRQTGRGNSAARRMPEGCLPLHCVSDAHQWGMSCSITTLWGREHHLPTRDGLRYPGRDQHPIRAPWDARAHFTVATSRTIATVCKDVALRHTEMAEACRGRVGTRRSRQRPPLLNRKGVPLLSFGNLSSYFPLFPFSCLSSPVLLRALARASSS